MQKITAKNIVTDEAIELPDYAVISFGEGREAVKISFDNHGNLRVMADRALLVLPQSGNTICLRTED